MALHDTLTRLPNRHALTQTLEQALAAGALLIIDADHYKQVNDGHGIGIGGQIIASIGNALRHVAHSGNAALFRTGGGEFAILPREGLAQDAVRMAERAPGAFMAAAESSGLIRDLDLRVLDKTLAHAAASAAPGEQRYFLTVSGVSISDTPWVNSLVSRLMASAVGPAQRVFEIDESALLADVDTAIGFIGASRPSAAAPPLITVARDSVRLIT